MYLHLGSDCMVKSEDIIAIFNLRGMKNSAYEKYFERYRHQYKIVNLSEAEERSSCILTKEILYLSPISSLTLKKRAEAGFLADAQYSVL
ncbi:MAG: DUF370 domain-containing protein [Phascolarctobacterium sp.]|nr:DUF370 domain-containing protein [Phascolarctobacterium sp.]